VPETEAPAETPVVVLPSSTNDHKSAAPPAFTAKAPTTKPVPPPEPSLNGMPLAAVAGLLGSGTKFDAFLGLPVQTVSGQ
jgi:hypothetical protein